MQGKIHPNWFIPTTSAPFVHHIKSYGVRDFVIDPTKNPDEETKTWYITFDIKTDKDTDDYKAVKVSPTQMNIRTSSFLTLTFNEKVKQITLVEKLYSSNNFNEQNLLIHRECPIKCYFIDDFIELNTLTPLDGSLNTNTISDACNIESISPIESKNITTELYGHSYVCKVFKCPDVWKLEFNPHQISSIQDVDYDFVLLKFIQYSDNNSDNNNNIVFDDKAIISNKFYYPMGWFEKDREYWVLLSKDENERLYFIRKGGFYGIGVREIQCFKLK